MIRIQHARIRLHLPPRHHLAGEFVEKRLDWIASVKFFTSRSHQRQCLSTVLDDMHLVSEHEVLEALLDLIRKRGLFGAK